MLIFIYTFNILLYFKINIRITVLKYFVFYSVHAQINKTDDINTPLPHKKYNFFCKKSLNFIICKICIFTI